MRYARGRVRSAHEVLAYLKRHQVSPRLLAHIVATCRAQGLVNDAACARLWAEEWARRGWAWGAIRGKLEAKGLPEEAIGTAEAQLGGEGGDRGRAQELIEQHGSAHPEARARIARRLASRGFDPELIERLLH
jgi:SOS response regulatory protein OraA/RecX